MQLATIDVNKLYTVVNARECDLRKDIHIFVDYCSCNNVKRSHRGNNLPMADYKKLAKLIPDHLTSNKDETYGTSNWLEFIDELALKLDFVRYDTKGVYIGYSSNEPSFPDNFIKVCDENYKKFLELPLPKQEQFILNGLVKTNDYHRNEFFCSNVMSALDRFDSWGCATGVMPTLNFPSIRNFLLQILSTCESGLWFSTESLISYLKESHPFFLIPQYFKTKNNFRDRGRYSNFSESNGPNAYSGKKRIISENSHDAFERVEGRYVERFLEGIPLVMGYVDVAYVNKPEGNLFPSIGLLKAFRVRDRLQKALKGSIPEPRVRVQPNFEIYVESDLYPAGQLSQLKLIADITKDDKVVILQLNREKVASVAAKNAGFDVPAFLKTLTGGELPKNVVTELGEWVQASDVFTLFEGFALLEESTELPAADEYTKERISPNLRIVRSYAELFSRLENEGCVPMLVRHENPAFKLLPEYVKTIFPRESITQKPKQAKPISLKRLTSITFFFPEAEIFEIFFRKLGEAQCPFESNRGAKSISISDHFNKQISNIVKELSKTYAITITDAEN